MFNMPITFGVERSISLPPAFILTYHDYTFGNDIDVYPGLGDFGDFFGIFPCIRCKVLLLGHRYFPYAGLTLKHNRFAYDILGHKKAIVLEPHQDRVALALAQDTDETAFLLADFHHFARYLSRVGSVSGEL